MENGSESADLARLRAEHALFRRLLDLDQQPDLDAVLREALGLIAETCEAQRGYVELYEESRRYTALVDRARLLAEEITDVRALISSGIIAEALTSGETVVTACALSDARFRDRSSVQRAHIEAVLCTPITLEQPRGVIYLQGRQQSTAFTPDDQMRIELCARRLAAVADRLLEQQRRRTIDDCTAEHRGRLRADGVVGRSKALGDTLRQIALVAPLDVSVLLTGQSGTGKTQLARVIHESGPRASQPFVELNCAALPEALVESELFGAAQGAHSTATRRIEGKVAAAERGTLLLDEIGELALPTQAKLLQLLQSKEYFPLGDAKPRRADVRIIAATNTNLQEAVAQRRFRSDLLFRLDVLPVRVPALAERREDIADLAIALLAAACRRHNLPHLELSHAARRALCAAEWPGNIRQLGNTIEAAAIRAAGSAAEQIEQAHCFPDSAPLPNPNAVTFQEATRRFQAEFLRDVLAETGWNLVETSQRLDLDRSRLYDLIRTFGLERTQK